MQPVTAGPPLLIVALLLILGGCRTTAPARAGAVGPKAGAGAEPGAPAADDLGHDHPLRGKIYDTRARAFVDEGEAVARLARAKVVILGEKHDNPEHHRIQARALEGMVRAGKRPAVAWEMITDAEAADLASWREQQPGDAEGLGPAVRWEERGWPPWELYRPIAEAALGAGLPLVPAGISGKELMQMVHGGAELPPLPPLAPEAEQRLLDVVEQAHCGHVKGKMVTMMARAQRRRDQHLARRTLTAAEAGGGAVLVAGNGHARRDYGVPQYLVAGGLAPEQIAALGILEVRHDLTDPARYVELAPEPAYDLLWFTPRKDNGDPCQRFAEQLKKMRK